MFKVYEHYWPFFPSVASVVLKFVIGFDSVLCRNMYIFMFWNGVSNSNVIIADTKSMNNISHKLPYLKIDIQLEKHTVKHYYYKLAQNWAKVYRWCDEMEVSRVPHRSDIVEEYWKLRQIHGVCEASCN